MRGKILTVEGKYGRRSREENGKEPRIGGSAAITLCWPRTRNNIPPATASPLASRYFAARIGGSAPITSCWPLTRDNIPPATQAKPVSLNQTS